MRKYSLVITFLVFVNVCFSQNPEINTSLPNVIMPKPTVSSLGTFAEVPVDNYTGVPSINVPITNFEISEGNSIGISLSYHLSNTNFHQMSSDTGTAWNFIGGGTISRTIIHSPDEGIPTSLNQNYDDHYSLVLPNGKTAVFQILCSTNYLPTDVIYINNENDLKITFEFESQTRIINKFIVYDAKGIKYIFDVIDKNVAMYYTDPPTALSLVNKIWSSNNSSYHLSKIVDNNNIELATYTYNSVTTVDTRPIIALTNVTNKLTEINFNRRAKVILNYTYESSYDNTVRDYSVTSTVDYSLDPYQLNEIKIYDAKNILQDIISLNYIFRTYEVKNYRDGHFMENNNFFRRYLEKVTFKNSSNATKSVERFTYYENEYTNSNSFYTMLNDYGYLNVYDICEIPAWYIQGYFSDNNPSIKNSNQIGALKSHINSLGGGYVIEYEPNDFSNVCGLTSSNLNITDQEFYELNDANKEYEMIYEANFNTAISRNYNFNVTSIPNLAENRIFFKFTANPLTLPINLTPSEIPPLNNHIVFRLLGNPYDFSAIVHDFSNFEVGNDINIEQNCIGRGLLNLSSGNYAINVGTFMNLHTTGTIKVYREKPVALLDRSIRGPGIRVKNIKHYENNIDFSGEPVKTKVYNYRAFTDARKSSGAFSYGHYGMDNRFLFPQICYENVKVQDFDGSLGYSQYTYKIYDLNTTTILVNGTIVSVNDYYDLYKSPHLLKVEVFNNNNQKLKEINNTYNFFVIGQYSNFYYRINPSIYSSLSRPARSQLISSVSKSYFYPNGTSTPNIVETSETFTYNTINKQIDEKTVTNSLGEILKTKYYYHTGNSPFSQNRISEIQKIETYRNSELLSTTQIDYSNTFVGNQSFLPQFIKTSKGTGTSENRVRFNRYDQFGNPLEVQQENGMKISYIYGYNKTQPIAKIENAAYASISPSLITNAQTASNTGTEASLLTALTAIRTALPSAMVTTYTYKPLIGVSTITDPKGDRITYIYDAFNRLKEVRDKDNNILSENQYNYRPQN